MSKSTNLRGFILVSNVKGVNYRTRVKIAEGEWEIELKKLGKLAGIWRKAHNMRILDDATPGEKKQASWRAADKQWRLVENMRADLEMLYDEAAIKRKTAKGLVN